MTADKTGVTAKKTATNKAPAKATKAAKPVAKPAAKKPAKEPKEKVVNDSFSMPKAEYLKIAEIKEACLKVGVRIKKSEVLRAGLKALGEMNQSQLESAIAGLGKVKIGCPKKP